MKTAARNRKHGRFTALGEVMILGYISVSPGRDSIKGAGTNSGESGARNLETESIRNTAESMEKYNNNNNNNNRTNHW